LLVVAGVLGIGAWCDWGPRCGPARRLCCRCGGGAGQFVLCNVFFGAGGFFEMSLLDVADVASDVCVSVGVGGFGEFVADDGGGGSCRGRG
jgi:hypothetical protein